MNVKTLTAVALVLCCLGGIAGASTVTLDFEDANQSTVSGFYGQDGFLFTGVHLNSGQCLDHKCAFLNPQTHTVLTRANGGAFSLDSLWFNFQGNPSNSSFVISTGGPDTGTLVQFTQGMFEQHHYFFQSLAGLFANVTALNFYGLDNANVRIDDLGVTVAAVPVPAAGALLVGALGALGAFVRRRRA